MLATIDRPARATLISSPGPCRETDVTLRYRPADPFAFRLVFPAALGLHGREVEWVFSRELLASGLGGPAGMGDVHIWPCGGYATMVELSSTEGTALLSFSTDELRRFLRASYAAVPWGREAAYLDLDRALDSLLGGPSGGGRGRRGRAG